MSKSKFHWGHGITIAIAIMVIAMFAFVFRVMQENVDLVTEEYYESDIEYQNRIERIKNTKELNTAVSYSIEQDSIKIVFPNDGVNWKTTGTIHFYKASNKNHDKVFDLNLSNSKIQTIAITEFRKGRYTAKIEWKGKEEYYQELEINIQ
jgi:hypothetical protein